MIDYHLHVVAHGDRPMTVENILAYCEVARERGILQMGITEHDRYLDEIDLAAFQEAREKSRDVELRLGIEIDFVPGDEERMEHDSNALLTTTSSGACTGLTVRRWITPTTERSTRNGTPTTSTKPITRTCGRPLSPDASTSSATPTS